MIQPSRDHKQYHSAHRRLLQATVAQFFETNYPKFFGPVIRERLAEALLALIAAQCPAATALRPGQCIWNAVARETRADSKKMRLVPVILTLVADTDITRMAAGESLMTVRQDAVARVLNEAYQQGALLSMRDIGLLTWQGESQITTARQAWETVHGLQLPHPGNLQDMGSCITHKTAIVVKTAYEKKDPRQVAQETHHSSRPLIGICVTFIVCAPAIAITLIWSSSVKSPACLPDWCSNISRSFRPMKGRQLAHRSSPVL